MEEDIGHGRPVEVQIEGEEGVQLLLRAAISLRRERTTANSSSMPPSDSGGEGRVQLLLRASTRLTKERSSSSALPAALVGRGG
jgi:hypothetical protein